MTPRQHFQAVGKLLPATRPVHEFQLGRWFLQWQLSADGEWADLGDGGHLITQRFQIAKVENINDTAFTRIVIGPLTIRTAILPKAA